jgi:hypothetical protein
MICPCRCVSLQAYVSRTDRFDKPGHRVQRPPRRVSGTYGAGWGFVHVAIDHTSRLAYVEVDLLLARALIALAEQMNMATDVTERLDDRAA